MNTQNHVISCPHCGTLKMVVSPTTSWWDTDYVLWSDGYLESKQWQGPAYTQQCPACKKFYTLPNKFQCEIKNVERDKDGMLSYQQLKTAIVELSGDEIPEARARLEAWWAYNIWYREAKDIPLEEHEYNRQNMQRLLDYHSEHSSGFTHLVFELNRLLGNKNVCEQMIEALTYEQYLSQRQSRLERQGRQSYLDEECLRSMYDMLMEELKSALSKPLEPYRK